MGIQPPMCLMLGQAGGQGRFSLTDGAAGLGRLDTFLESVDRASTQIPRLSDQSRDASLTGWRAKFRTILATRSSASIGR